MYTEDNLRNIFWIFGFETSRAFNRILKKIAIKYAMYLNNMDQYSIIFISILAYEKLIAAS